MYEDFNLSFIIWHHFSFFTVIVAGGVISFSPFVYCERGPGPSADAAPYIMIIRRHQHATCKRFGVRGRVYHCAPGGGRAPSKLQHEIASGYEGFKTKLHLIFRRETDKPGRS
jgi:hypothetical protein